jgi:RimJ/RimL family protein N-acetyltransferase
MSRLRSLGSFPSGGLKRRWLTADPPPEGTLVCETPRLILRQLTERDARFMLKLLNDPSFIRFIGDKGARTLDDARQYIAEGPLASYRGNGFGLYLVQIKGTAERIGMCGLVKRDALLDVDIGFAFLPAYWSKGYALEASTAVMKLARESFGIRRVVAITSTDNEASMSLLRKIGLQFDRTCELPGHKGPVNLFTPDADARRPVTVPPARR